LRTLARKAGLTFDPDFIEKVALACRSATADEEILRVLYYDCAPFNGTATLPVSGQKTTFQGSDQWLHDLARVQTGSGIAGACRFSANHSLALDGGRTWQVGYLPWSFYISAGGAGGIF
jgi:hypothetical protein